MNATLRPSSPLHFNLSALNVPSRAQKDYLVYFLVLSALLHVLLLFVQFTDHLRKQDDDGTRALQVVLVNAKSANRPLKADVLAQANLDGGGNTDDPNARASSPFPTTQNSEPHPELKKQQNKIHELEQQQARLLTQLKSISAIEKPAPATRTLPDTGQTPDATDLIARSLQMARLEAKVERDFLNYETRPKKRFVGTKSLEFRDAQYVDNWRLKIERVGDLNYPEEARKKKIYGSLRITVYIGLNGELLDVEINQTSGSKILDEAAVRILRLASPYSPLPENIRKDTDILVITRSMFFTRSDQFVSE